MAELKGTPIPEMPDAGQLDGTEQLYVVRNPQGPVNRRTTVNRVREGMATLDDLNNISVGAGNVPAGGAAGAALLKASADSYDMIWDPTSGTGWVPDPTNEADGRTLVTDTGGLVYVDLDPSGGLVPDPSGATDGHLVTVDDDGYMLAAPLIASVNGKTGAVSLDADDVGAVKPAALGSSAALDVGTSAGTVAAGNDSRIVGALPAATGIVVVDSPTPVTRPTAKIVLWLDDSTNAVAGDWRPTA